MSKLKIVITGANGQLGRELTEWTVNCCRHHWLWP